MPISASRAFWVSGFYWNGALIPFVGTAFFFVFGESYLECGNNGFTEFVEYASMICIAVGWVVAIGAWFVFYKMAKRKPFGDTEIMWISITAFTSITTWLMIMISGLMFAHYLPFHFCPDSLPIDRLTLANSGEFLRAYCDQYASS